MTWRSIGDFFRRHKPGHSQASEKEEGARASGPSPLSIFLFADSQLLFWEEDGLRLAERIRDLVGKERPRAAYVQASGGDDCGLFTACKEAMGLGGVEDCRMIYPSLPWDELAYLETADIIFLAGEDVQAGWDDFEAGGLAELISRRYYEGALLVGLSAGSTQLGRYGWRQDGDGYSVFEAIRLVPFVVGVRGEACSWESLKKAVTAAGGRTHGIGIPSGGGIMYHADRSIEAVRHAAFELSLVNNQIVCNPLPPGILWEAADPD